MKKFHVLALSAIVAMGTLATSCDGGSTGSSSVTPNASLKTEADSLSYALGVQIGEGGLAQYLQQLGVAQDTAMFRQYQIQLIDMEADPAKKAEMQDKLASRIDSLNKANTEGMANFIKGIQASIGEESKAKQDYYAGIQVGYQIQTVMIKNMEKQILDASGEKANVSAVLAGVLNVLKKEPTLIQNAPQLLQEKAMAAQSKMQKEQEEKLKKDFADKIEAGKKFMEENKAQAGVVTLPSGLQYKVVKEGKGQKPTATDRVSVFYKGSLTDGTVFETNEGADPVTFGVSQVIPGWTEALQLMPAGSKWTLYIPYDLAYGGQEGGTIPPFSNLIFDVELVSIEK